MPGFPGGVNHGVVEFALFSRSTAAMKPCPPQAGAMTETNRALVRIRPQEFFSVCGLWAIARRFPEVYAECNIGATRKPFAQPVVVVPELTQDP
jgi:hypothetical protein